MTEENEKLKETIPEVKEESLPPDCHCEPVHISRFLEEEPSEAGLLRKGRAAEGAGFPDAKGNSGSALPGADSADTEFPQRSKNRRISVSPNDSSGTARRERDDPELVRTHVAISSPPESDNAPELNRLRTELASVRNQVARLEHERYCGRPHDRRPGRQQTGDDLRRALAR